MCMEDVRLGRMTGATEYDVQVSTSSIELVPFSANRLSLIISSPVANRITISTDPNVVDQKGIVLYAAGAPMVLNIKDHGKIVTKQLFAIANTGTSTVGILEAVFTGELS